MATFIGGLIVGLLNCWQIALLTLATGPLIVAAGGISNIFLHRLAENIQDAYAEAASIAEQVATFIQSAKLSYLFLSIHQPKLLSDTLLMAGVSLILIVLFQTAAILQFGFVDYTLILVWCN